MHLHIHQTLPLGRFDGIVCSGCVHVHTRRIPLALRLTQCIRAQGATACFKPASNRGYSFELSYRQEQNRPFKPPLSTSQWMVYVVELTRLVVQPLSAAIALRVVVLAITTSVPVVYC